jgi:hypothetical protein
MPKFYPSLGKCIYCFDDKSKLTDEHIIPLSLQGDWVFDDASCLVCNRITHEFETPVINTLEHFRVRYGVNTRRPRVRKKFFTLDAVGKDGMTKKVTVPAAEVPAVAMLYKFGRANILQGKPPFDPTFEWLPVPYFDHAALRQAMAKYSWDGQLQSKMVPEQFARMLAKIAYSYAIAELGFGAFEPLCLDIILGKSNNYSYTVGGSFDLKPEADGSGDHFITLGMIDQPNRPKLVIVNIRLFQQMGTPHHYVIVGHPQTDAQVSRIEDYLADSCAMKSSYPGV